MEKAAIQLHSLDLFLEGGSYIDSSRLFFSYFKKVPKIKTIGKINTKKLSKWLESVWEDNIVSIHARQHYRRDEKKLNYVDAFYLLDNNILLNLDNSLVRILHDPSQEETAKDILFQFPSLILLY